MKILANLTLVFTLLITVKSSADVPGLMNYQGYLTDSGGTAVADGAYDVIFTIYNSIVGGTAIWAETLIVNTSDGRFSVLLGGTNPLDQTLFSDPSRYMGISIEGESELTPRNLLVSVPYAFQAGLGPSQSSSSNQTTITIAATLAVVIQSATISCPTSGYVLATFNGEFAVDNTSSDSRVEMGLCLTDTTFWGGLSMTATWPGSTGDYSLPVSMSRIIPVGAGNQVINFAAKKISGDSYAFEERTLILVFFPEL